MSCPEYDLMIFLVVLIYDGIYTKIKEFIDQNILEKKQSEL